GRKRAAGMRRHVSTSERVFPRHCEERSDEAIHVSALRRYGLLRFARNDGCHPAAPIAYGFSIAYSIACVGVGMPYCLPSSTTLPESHGTSSRLPRSRSSAIEAFIGGGMELVSATILSTASAGSETPLARPTSATSR